MSIPKCLSRREWVLLTLFASVSFAANARAQITRVTKTGRGVQLATPTNVIDLQAFSTGTIRVQVAPGKSIPQKSSLVIVDTSAPAPWTTTEDAQAVKLSIGGLTASVDKKTGLLTFLNHDGGVLLQTTPDGTTLKPATQPARDGLQPGQSFVRNPGERFFGMGVIGDQLNQPTATIPLLNNNRKIQVPVLYSTRGYGVLWDNASKGQFDLSPTTVSWRSSAGDDVDYYLMAGPSADQVIAQYRALTGAAPLFPKWAYGFWFCKNRFKSQDEILQAAADFRSHKIPIDLIVQDYYYWQPNKPTFDGQNWGSHQFDSERYPDPRAMIAQLHDKDHLHFMVVVWAKFDPATQHAKELDAAGALFPLVHEWSGPMRYYDPFGSRGREIYGRQVMESLLPLGVDAFWVDAAEPEMDKNIYAGFDSPAGPVSRIMNAFPLMHTMALHDAMRAATNKRVLLLPRSAWAGMQRNGASNWTGDIRGDWKTLDWQIQGLQNYSIAGLPYITTDIGGYSPTNESDQEHFLRWFEWGSFCPVFRVHGVNRAFPWQYGPEAETIIRNINDLHYRLLPYIYSNAADVTQHAGTIMRPLVMDFCDDPKAVDTWDEFMYGPQLLVCPVHESRYERMTVSPDQFSDADSKPGGLSVTYIKSGTEKPTRVDMPLSFSLGKPADSRSVKSVRFEGSFTPKENGELIFRPVARFGDGKLTIDGKSFTPSTAFEHITVPVDGKAGTAVHFVFETTDLQPIFEILRDRFAGKTQSRAVYLPAGTKWYDFWTGQEHDGGQTITADAPLDRIPLYVRAGSVLPMGPKLQYADEHPADPIELRVYPGTDGAFTLYEDQGDTYAYEKGAFATIPISWNDKTKMLSIGDRQGSFPGMMNDRTFRVVLVQPNHGEGIEQAKVSNADIKYAGKAMQAAPSTTR
jgi:alpha-D-xyloside xylohydrolase